MRRAGIFLYFVAVLGVAAMAYRKPLPTFDRLQYAVTVAHLHSSDPAYVVTEAFRLSPPGEYPKVPYTEELLRNPELMLQHIPFYAIRPIYIHALDLLGLRTVSPLAYFALSVLVLYWVGNPWWSLAIMLLPDPIMLARTVTPDALSTAVVLSAMFLAGAKKDHWAVALLLISLGIRTDNLFFLAGVLLLAIYRGRLKWYVAGAIGIAGVVLVLGIGHYTHAYGWALRMRVMMANADAWVAEPAKFNPAPLTLREYATQLMHAAIGMTSLSLSLWIMLGYITWVKERTSRDLLLVAATYSVIHLVVFPIPETRYFVPAFLIVAVVFVRAMLKDSSIRSFSQTWFRVPADLRNP